MSSPLHSKVFWSARNSCSVGELLESPNIWVIRRSKLSSARERALVDERADTSCVKVGAYGVPKNSVYYLRYLENLEGFHVQLKYFDPLEVADICYGDKFNDVPASSCW